MGDGLRPIQLIAAGVCAAQCAVTSVRTVGAVMAAARTFLDSPFSVGSVGLVMALYTATQAFCCAWGARSLLRGRWGGAEPALIFAGFGVSGALVTRAWLVRGVLDHTDLLRWASALANITLLALFVLSVASSAVQRRLSRAGHAD